MPKAIRYLANIAVKTGHVRQQLPDESVPAVGFLTDTALAR